METKVKEIPKMGESDLFPAFPPVAKSLFSSAFSFSKSMIRLKR